MVAMTLSRTTRNTSSVRHFLNRNTLFAMWVAMSSRDDTEKLWKREGLSLKEKLDAYLDGYMMSFDMYPVCERHLFIRNDAYALLKDFFAVGEDVNKSLQKLLEASAEEFSDMGLEPDEIRRRRIEAAKRALTAIERTADQLKRASERANEADGGPRKTIK
jgi:hypothetical protein